MKKETINTEAISTTISNTIESSMYGMTDHMLKCFEQMMSKMNQTNDVVVPNSISDEPETKTISVYSNKDEWAYATISKEYGKTFADIYKGKIFESNLISSIPKLAKYMEIFGDSDVVYLSESKEIIGGTRDGIMYHEMIHYSKEPLTTLWNCDKTYYRNGKTFAYNSNFVKTPDSIVFKYIIRKRSNCYQSIARDNYGYRFYIDTNTKEIINAENLRSLININPKNIMIPDDVCIIHNTNYNSIYKLYRYSDWYEYEEDTNENNRENKTNYQKYIE